jgi:methylisocitrate lyase
MPYLTAADTNTRAPGLQFRDLLDRPGILELSGAHNGMEALQAKQAGFDVPYLSGAAMTASMGIPDLGIITVDEGALFIRQLKHAADLPILADGDTGYGEVLNIMHVVRAFEDAGAAAVQLEINCCPKSAAI